MDSVLTMEFWSMNSLRKVILHPFLLGVYVVLGLLIPNFDQVEWTIIIRPLAIILGAALILLLLLWVFIRDWVKASLVVTLFFVLFFSYGHIYAPLKSINISGMFLFRHRTLFPLWLVILTVCLILLLKIRSLVTLNYYLNLVTMFLVGITVFQIILLAYQANQNVTLDALPAQGLSQAPHAIPDIYYIILDGYGRQDVLQNVMHYDNSAFIAELEGLGFHVAQCSQSNYAQTQMSLASSLNFDYLDTLRAEGDKNATEKANTGDLIKHSRLRQFLEARGYVTIAFATGFNFTQITDADLYLAPQPGRQLNEFEYLLVKTTMARLILDYQLGKVEDSTAELFRQRTRFTIDKLDTLYQDPRPKFVFAHIVIPHPPFVFGSSGEPVERAFTRDDEFSPEEYIAGYTGQVTYVNHEIIGVLGQIVQKTNGSAIIILQGDHGPGRLTPEARMGILNAYFLPDMGKPALYETITPVNSFRVILNAYFDQDLPLLEDISRFSLYNLPYTYTVIENTCGN
jgi:Sulfatase